MLGHAAILLVSAVLAFGVVSTGLAGYFESVEAPGRALDWRPRSPTALAQAAEAFAAREDYAGAAAAARRALKQSTLNAPALRVLALSAAAAGREDEARSLMKQVVSLNMRDGSAHAWLLGRALARADYAETILHADAIMRRSADASSRMTLVLMQAMETNEGRQALARRLERNPPWRTDFLSVLGRNGDIEQTGALLEVMATTALPPTDEEVAPFIQRLVAAMRFQDARTYWRNLSPRSPLDSPLVHDGDFAGRAAPPPLTWQTIRVRGGSAALTGETGASLGHLRLRHDGFSSSGTMARQLIFLPPGAYVVRARADVDEPAGGGRFRLEIGCAGGPRLTVLNLAGQPGRRIVSDASFAVPHDRCAAQWLIFRPNTGERRELVEMRIDDVQIRPDTGAEAPGR